MKLKNLLLPSFCFVALASVAQNVGINSTGAAPVNSAALDVDMANKGVLIPRVALTTTASFAPVTGTATVSLLVYNTATAGISPFNVTPGYYYWDGVQWVRFITGAASNNWIIGGSVGAVNLPGTVGYLGTSDNNHIDLVTNGAVRGRFSNLGELFVGATSTVLAGDLMNGVGNASFPWAVNGYTAFNGAAVYGQRQATSAATWGSVQGETAAAIAANNSGVSGLASANTHRGVLGQKPAGGLGWGGLFLNDLGYTGGAYNASDERLKIGVKPYEGALGKVMEMRFYTYYMDTVSYDALGDGRMHYGVMAQELKEQFPSLVATKSIGHNGARNSVELRSPEFDINMVNYTELIPVALQAIKEQQEIIDALQRRLDELEKRTK
jgi:hypothetical protein